MAKLTVTDELLAAALAGYQAELEQIDLKMGEIRRMLGDRTSHAAAPSDTKTPKRKFSAASRRKMRIAQKLRWEKIKEAAEPPQAESQSPNARSVVRLGQRWPQRRRQGGPRLRRRLRRRLAVAKRLVRKKSAAKKAA